MERVALFEKPEQSGYYHVKHPDASAERLYFDAEEGLWRQREEPESGWRVLNAMSVWLDDRQA